MSRTTNRTRRVSELLQEELGRMLQTELADERLRWVSIVSIDVAPDLGSARVYYSCMPGTEAAEDPEGIQRVLDHASGYLRSELGRTVAIRRIPELRFEPDASLEYGDYMNRLLRSLDTGGTDDGE